MLQTVAAITGAIVLVAALYLARDALMLIYVAALIAMGFAPVVRFLQGPHARALPRTLAIFAVYVAVIGIFVIIGLIVVPPLVAQAGELWNRVPLMFDAFQRFLLRHQLTTRHATLQEAVQNAPAGTGGNAVSTAFVAISSLVSGLFEVVTVLILSFYFLIEAESISNYLIRFVPEDKRTRVATASRQAVRKVSAWLRAQILLASVMGVLAAVGLGLMGEPYFYVIALIAAAGETIPIVGPLLAGTTAVIVALTSSTKLAVTVGLFFLALHELEANILVPKIMQARVGVSPVAVIMGLLIGGALWGVIGAVLAIPTVAILSIIVDELAPHYSSVEH